MYENLTIRVERIENGFIVTAGKGAGYSDVELGRTYYATMGEVEAALPVLLRSAAALDIDAKGERF